MTQITSEGFLRTRLDERLSRLEDAIRAIYGDDIDLSPESPDGQLLAVFAEAIADCDQMAEAVYLGRSPAGSIGAGLARLVRLNGVLKKGPQYSTVTATLSGTPGTVIPAGSLVANADDETAVFKTTADVTIAGGGSVAAEMQATIAGPLSCSAGRLTEILTVIRGWPQDGCTNALAAALGTLGETDSQLRVRRAASVALPSQGLSDGLAAAIAQLSGVEHVKVYQNRLDTPATMTGGATLAPHAIQAVVDGGAAADIAAVLWLHGFPGTTMVGAQSQDIVDSQGFTQTMKYDQPADANIYVTVQLSATVGGATKTLIKDAIVAWGQANAGIGDNVIWSQLFIPINSVPGLSVTALYLGTAPSPSAQADLTIAYNSIARWSSARISVLP